MYLTKSSILRIFFCCLFDFIIWKFDYLFFLLVILLTNRIVTFTGKNETERVPIACPVLSGTVFYGVVPAPPERSVAPDAAIPRKLANGQTLQTSSQLCARLVSSSDYCTNGVAGPADRMKYTVSECVDQTSSDGGQTTKPPKTELVFEGQSIYIIPFYHCKSIRVSIIQLLLYNYNYYYYDYTLYRFENYIS